MTDGRRVQRTTKPTKIPGIPKPPADVPASLQRYLSNLSEALEIRLGRKGDPRDRAITLRELISSGVAAEISNGSFDPDNPGNDFGSSEGSSTDVEAPTTPAGVSITVGFSNVGIFWDYPRGDYRGHSFTEVFRNTTNTLSTAQLLTTTPGNSVTDFHGSVTTQTVYYYWIRHVNVNDVRGPFHANSGLQATLSPSVDFLLNTLTNSITSSELVQSLRDPIENLPANTSGSLVSISNDVTSLESQYTVKIQTNSANGTYVSGYGLANTTVNGNTTSAFIVAANRFAVINPATYSVGQTNNNPATTYTPFVVQSTATSLTLPSGEVVDIPAGVFIDSAFISKARILDLIAGSVQADFLLSSSFVRSPNIHGGTFNIGTFSNNGSTDPSDWTITGSNRVSNFSVDANGIMHATAAKVASLSIFPTQTDLDNGTNPVFDSNGFNGTYIKDASVDTLQLAGEAVTIPQGASGSLNISLGTSFVKCGEVTIDYGAVNDNPSAVVAVGSVQVDGSGSANQGVTVALRRVYGNNTFTGISNTTSIRSDFGGQAVTGGKWSVNQVSTYTSFKMEIHAKVSTGTRTATKFFISVIGSKR